MLHPPMTIRPDEIYRSGSIQPFSVQTMDPVQFARHEIDPFIQSIRPAGPQVETLEGPFGIVRAGQVPTLGIVRAGQVPTLGAWNDKKWVVMYCGGALLLGLVAGVVVGSMKKKKGRRK